VRIPPRLAVTAILLAVFALTNRWPGWTDPGNAFSYGDPAVYVRIARAAPGFVDDTIGSAYTQRFASHWLVGVFHRLTGLELHQAYLIALVACLGALVLAMHRILAGLRLSLPAYALSVALLILNPYALRPYAKQPGALQDLVFVLGVAMLLQGLLRRRLPAVLLGLALAVAGRQSALPVAAVAALWMLAAPPWRELPRKRRVEMGALAVVVTAAIYVTTVRVAAPFTEPFWPSFPHDTILPLIGSLPSSASKLGTHVLRVAVPLLIPGALLVAASAAGRLTRLPAEAWGCLAIAASIVVQPLVISPDFPGFEANEPRLSALALVPLTVAVAIVIRELEERLGALRREAAILAVALLAAGSLRTVYTFVGPSSLAPFLAVQLAVAILVPLIVLAPRLARSPP
jgi:hypothetical protein